MSVSPTCRTPLPIESFVKVRASSTVKELPAVEVPPTTEERELSMTTLFHALSYIGRSRNADDVCAFYVLHQVFVAITRHDKVEQWPSVDAMLDYARHKALETGSW